MGRVKALLAPFGIDEDEYVDATEYIKALEENEWIAITEIVKPCMHPKLGCVHANFEYDPGTTYGYDRRCGLTVKARKLPPIGDRCLNCKESWKDSYPCECAFEGVLSKEWKYCYNLPPL